MEHQHIERSVLAAPIELAQRSSGANKDQQFRSMFMRDRDRVLYSKSFRRLSGKTQVYASGSGDHRRTRLTHTLEVSQIARTISAGLGLDCDLTEAIALGHDIGHTPFGHAGERILHEIMSPKATIDAQLPKNTVISNLSNDTATEYLQYFGFKHNCQSVRTAIRLESNYGINGLDLTNFTLWGMFFHSSNQYKPGKVSTQHLTLDFFDQYRQTMSVDGKNPAWSFEAYVVKEADEIAQRHHDLEDAIRSGAVSRTEVCQLIYRNLRELMCDDDRESFRQMRSRKTDDETFIAYMSRIVVNTLVNRLIEYSQMNMQKVVRDYNINRQNAVGFFKEHLHTEAALAATIGYVTIEDSKDKKNKVCRCISNFQKAMTEKILNSYDVQCVDSKGKYIIKKLFESYYTNPQQLPDYAIELYLLDVGEYKSAESIQQTRVIKGMGVVRSKFMQYHSKHSQDVFAQIKLMRVICDDIAGMTDTYAISEYEKLYG